MKTRFPLSFFFLLSVSSLCSLGGSFQKAHADSTIPPELEGIKIDAKLGTQAPLQTIFTDQDGKQVPLQYYFQNNQPVLLTLNYYGCATLCNHMLNNIKKALAESSLRLTPGVDFQIITVSIDHREKPSLAKAKRATYLSSLQEERIQQLAEKKGALPENMWPFLTGDNASISFLAQGVGFGYRYDAKTDQFAHTSGVYILTPNGKISQILDAITLSGETLRLALTEASEGKLGSITDRILLWCYHYDFKVGKYTAVAWKLMRAAGILTVLGLIIFLGTLWRKERSRRGVRHE